MIATRRWPLLKIEMTSTFESEFNEVARADHFDEFGESIDYTPPSGNGRSLTAILGPVTTERIETDAGEVERKIRNVTVAADLETENGGIDTENLKGAFTIDGKLWGIERVVDQDDVKIVFEVVRVAPARVGRKVHDNPLRR